MTDEGENKVVKEKEDSKKIQIHLDGHDFQGFSLRMLGIIIVWGVIIWFTNLEELWVLLITTICWLVFFGYKIMRFKEDAYQQIIEDLESKNAKLEKTNQLLENVVKDTMGMRIRTDDTKKPEKK